MRAVLRVDAGRNQILRTSLTDGVVANFGNLDDVLQTDLSHADCTVFGFPFCPEWSLMCLGKPSTNRATECEIPLWRSQAQLSTAFTYCPRPN